MLIALGLTLVTAAAQVRHLAAPGITTVDVPVEAASFYTEHLAQALARHGLLVMTPKQLEAVLGLERQKQLLGCAESSCMVELANALGVDGLLLGEIGRFGERYQINLKIVSAIEGLNLGRGGGRQAVDFCIGHITHTSNQSHQ